MFTIEELESACDSPELVELPKHMMEPPELPFHATFYPFGFPAVVKTNRQEVLAEYEQMWGKFEKQHDTDPIVTEVQVIETDCSECPPEPSYRLMLPFFFTVADADNYGAVDLDQCLVKISVSTAALQNPLYARYFLLGIPVCCVSTRYSTPVHAGCVELNGHGVLLCGDSGAGKSTLSYACARAGWTYITDDASYLLNGGSARRVIGNCHQVRFRPSAGELFPELHGLEITPRAAGKPSIELPTGPMRNIRCSQTARVDYIVFLNRRWSGPADLVPYREDVARQFMRQVLFGPRETRIAQHQAIEKLLAAEVLELRYTKLDEAIDRLRSLVEEGK